MTQLTEFIELIPDYLGIFLLMLSAFLIGYFTARSQQRNKYSKLLKNIKSKSQRKRNTSTEIADIETIFSEIKPKIVEVVKEETQISRSIANSVPEPEYTTPTPTPEEDMPTIKSPEDIMKQARTSYVNYTKSKPKLNFENFGYASFRDKDDLTRINGIGPYIEQRLNEIGIYNYDQISRFAEDDIRVLTELIDFFPGRIDRDNWVAQAAALTIQS